MNVLFNTVLAGAIAMVMVILFLGGLAISIGSLPFGIITAVVLLVAVWAYIDEVRSALRGDDVST
ncbi:hypothetical protein [Varunaivibrio sulfuroxidans]|uniref:Uncharacterized protein n=1 Tax=Varunaivibrio sulfuroxidans TaxID=1773489 RepID=A0A4R3JFG8_9PROT|nr:hypothetical protein [Varunaivibrio sulfuroxidans]TCS64013.1 hypothetical protein EDD55_10250 [Varunaivibrio sulfuroxidans]WES31535.1 hypothetical protein P3M64_03965 [Varunaivibrio sulfuroxidans]